jgi:chromosome segregation ATPase
VTPSRPDSAVAELAALEQQVRQLRESLAKSNEDLSRLQAHTADLQSQVEAASAENQRLSSAGQDLKKSLADADQTLESLRAELKRNTDRVAQLEANNARLKDETTAGKQSAAQIGQTMSELQEIFRRREMYLNNILRRYKEITEQYRAMSGVLDSRRDREAAPVSTTEISRIQNAIALAEDDLKQINALNAQSQRLQKKLPVK